MRTKVVSLVLLLLAAAACGASDNAKRAPIPTAPALDGGGGGVPCDSARGGPILGGGGRC